MFKNYVIVAFRNLWKNKAYSFLNIAGKSGPRRGYGLQHPHPVLGGTRVRKDLRTIRFSTEAADIYYIRENQTYEGR